MTDFFKFYLKMGIKKQLIISISLVHAIMMSIFIFDLVSRQKEFLHSQSITQTKSLAQSLAANSTSWVMANDFVGLEEIVVSMANFPSIHYAMVLDLDGKLLAYFDTEIAHTSNQDQPRVGMYVTDKISLKLIGKSPELFTLINNENEIDIAYPIMFENQHLGWTRISVAQTENISNLQFVTRNGIVYTLLAILIGIFAAAMMGATLTRKLYTLMRIIKRTGQGERGIRAEEKGHDEISNLSHEVNLMFNSTEKIESEIKKLNSDLEVIVQERTEKIKAQNFQLITEMKKNRDNEKLLIQNTKMIALGEMIGNIAHQWRQPLNSIGLRVQLLSDIIDNNEINKDECNEEFAQILNSLQYLSQTINDFRGFLKEDKEKIRFKISEAVTNSLKIVNATLKDSDITCNLNVTNDDEINGFAHEYAQVLINIISNAKDALNSRKDLAHKFINIELLKSDDKRSILTITNNGGEIKSSVLEKIFDPYFTTKFKSEGTGLGLYMSKIIIEQNMEGELSAQNIDLPNGERGVRFIIIV